MVRGKRKSSGRLLIVSGVCKNVPKPAQGQRGLALLIFAIMISLASITIYFNSVSVASLKNEQKKTSGKRLADAKQALLAYAATFSDSHLGEYGFLPPPDIDTTSFEGVSKLSPGPRDTNTLGMFPWAAGAIGTGIATGPLKSGAGGCLWYALTGSYMNVGSAKTQMLNEDTNGLFRLFDANDTLIIGAQPENRIVALIIDPQQPVASQSRSFDNSSLCGLDYTAADFLEGNGSKNNAVLTGVADAVDDFIRGNVASEQGLPPFQDSPPFNDRIEVITRDELWQAVLSRQDFTEKMQNLTAALAGCVANYANVLTGMNRRLPWPAPYDFAGADYRLDNNYSDVSGAGFYAGRFPFNVNDSNSLMSIPPGNDDILDISGLCNSVDVPNPPGSTVDLTDANGEYRKLWKNWKDHFFYILSKAYEPGMSGMSSCGAGDCISVGGTSYAGVVVFSGSRLAGQSRSAPLGGDPDDDKADVSNYMEDGRDAFFPSTTGSGAMNAVSGGSNDFMYCIEKGMMGTMSAMSC